MRENDKITLHNILQHKEHFDQKLIDINQNFMAEVITLSSLNTKLSGGNQSYQYKISSMNLKIMDLENQNTHSRKSVKMLKMKKTR